ncbi:MAG TPA: siderophore-interacting protein [Polyangiaceae bacterium]
MSGLKARLLGGWLGDRLLRDATVTEVEDLGKSYRRISLVGASLRDATCEPGDKVQIFLPEIGARTYTPFAFDREVGRIDLLVYLHGTGPGAQWARSLEPSTVVRLLGPRSSLPLPQMDEPVALFGDETSLAVARSLYDIRAAGRGAVVRIEVDSTDEAKIACEAIGLPSEVLVERTPGSSHLDRIARDLAGVVKDGGSLALSGNAHSIQLLRRHLKGLGVDREQKVKAYWAEGKRGLD